MSAQDFRRMQQGSMGWREWEDAFDGLLREGGWDWWADRVVPVARIRSLLQTYRVPKPAINKLIGMIQSLGRIPGLPDRVIARHHKTHDEIGVELGQLAKLSPYLLGAGPPDTSTVSFNQPVTVIGFVELKTGSGKATPEQAKWLRLVAQCPGCFAAVGRAEHQDYWRKVLVA